MVRKIKRPLGLGSKIPAIEARYGAPIRDLLVDRYYLRQMTLEQIAAEWGVTASAISRWMKRLGLPTREPIWVVPSQPNTGGEEAAS